MKKVIISLLIVLFVMPMMILLIRSLFYEWKWPEFIPHQFQIETWHSVLTDQHMLTALAFTSLIGLVVVISNLSIGMLAGKGLAFGQFKGKTAIDLFLTAPILIPTLAIVFGLHTTFLRLGFINQWWGVALVHVIPTLPYTVRIFRSGYERLGKKYIEQAKTLGVSRSDVFWSIEVPLLLPSIRSVYMLVLLISFSQYVLTAIIGGGGVITLAILYYPYFHSANLALIATYSIVFLLLPIGFLLFFEGLIRLYRRYSYKESFREMSSGGGCYDKRSLL